MHYPVAESALEKWSRQRLELVENADAGAHLRFRYNGSTCTNGGTPFEASLHMMIDRDTKGIDRAWIEISKEHEKAAGLMCAARKDNAFFERLAMPARICGETLAAAIEEDIALNYAGCFCSEPMVNEKWKLAVSTAHYALAHGYV